ncbi:MAG: hypothetical protein IJ072_00795, partial [Oscillospiraceae bacterium]|nr:hypothetical protein [Oscillospiraceae bacterium]
MPSGKAAVHMRRSDFTLKLISAVLLVAIACYIGFYLIRSSSNTIQTSRAMMVTAGTSCQTTGYAVRDEYVLPGGGNNVAASVRDGQKVSNGEVIAVEYSGQSALERAGRIRTLQARISQLRELTDIQAGNLTSQTIKSLAYAVQHNDFDALEELRLSANACIFGSSSSAYVSTDAELSALNLELAQLESTGSGSVEITAPESGTFTTVTDGFEDVTVDMVEYKKPSEVEALFENAHTEADALGKLVRGTTWYYAAIMDEEHAAMLDEGQSFQVNFTKTYNAALTMTVKSVGAVEDGRCVVVFSSERDLAPTISIRNLTAEVMFSNDTGILVAKQAVHLDDEDKPFVYVLM